ncbi:hypothetical protein NKI34_19795 [Mesorhizobium sp. M0700]|uniref:hypothetical protein n=1 Tax=Mesorhizobium sp. M0700 TaxID=2956988 RepID=UPI00333812DD
MSCAFGLSNVDPSIPARGQSTGSCRRRGLGASTYVLSARLDARVAAREELSRPIKVFEAGAIARLNHDAPAFRRLMAGESAVFIAATAFSVRMIMEEVSLMRSQNPMHGPCQRRKTLFNNGLVDFRSCRKSDMEGRLTAALDLHVDVAFSE